MTAALVEIAGVGKRFGTARVLHAIDLSVRPGERVGLVGPDGAGKSTLLRIVAGLMKPDAGVVRTLGAAGGAIDRTRLGYMPQAFGLYDRQTVDENIALYAALHGLAGERRRIVDALLRRFDLIGARDRAAGALSGGMRQKLSLLCTVLHDPALLLLDEPAVGLDPVSRRDIWAVLDEQRDRGVGVLLSTAYLDEAERCDTVVMLREGALAYAGPPAALAARMAGRVFLLPVREGAARRMMREVMADPAVTDAVPLGNALRLSFPADRPELPGALCATDAGGPPEPVAPRLEDGFLDLAGRAETGVPAFLRDYPRFPDSAATPAIAAEGLTRYYGAFAAADDVHFAVRHGEVFGLLGPNGAGKSTVFKMLCGLVRPSGGVGRVAGCDLRHAGHHARQAFGYMAQRFSLYGDLSVRQNLDYFAGCYGLRGQTARAAIERMIDAYHLRPHVERNAGSLPLGFRQRLALACAVIHRPGVLFLDEPTSGVDPILRREFWSHIDALVERGVAVLVTTHFMEEAERCDRLTIIHRGRQIATGTPAALKRAAGDPQATMETVFAHLVQAWDAQGVAA